jgi:hypothetical protein
MEAAINFYELKTQLADLGFVNPELIDGLREMIFLNPDLHDFHTIIGYGEYRGCFSLSYEKDQSGLHRLYCIEGGMDKPGISNNQVTQNFQPDVPVQDAMQLLTLSLTVDTIRNPFIPLNLEKTQAIINSLKSIIMNTQNLEFLKKSLLNLGFGEKVNNELEKQIEKKTPDFALSTRNEFNQQKVDYTLHFKAGDSEEMYFFNKYEAAIKNGKNENIGQTFYINKGNGITAKEAFNLMEGRAVHKLLFNKEGEKYQAWLQLDNENLTQNGSREIKRFNENYGFDIEKTLSDKGIKEMATEEGQTNLIRSLKKGNAQQITVEKDGEEKKYFISASPQFKTIDLYDDKMKKIKREELLQPVQKKNNTQKRSQEQKVAPEKKSNRRTIKI